MSKKFKKDLGMKKLTSRKKRLLQGMNGNYNSMDNSFLNWFPSKKKVIIDLKVITIEVFFTPFL